MKYASRASSRGQAGRTGAQFDGGSTSRPSGGGGIGAGFGGPSDRNGPIGPTMLKAAKTAVDTTPRLLNDRSLQSRDNSGGFVLPPSYARHTLFRDGSQGGVGSPRNDLANQTARRDGQARDTQFQEPARQKEQTIARPGPAGEGGKVGTPTPVVKRTSLAAGET